MNDLGYVVSWEIFLEAGSAQEAVYEALDCLKPKEPGKWLFQVTNLTTGRQRSFERLDLIKASDRPIEQQTKKEVLR